MSKTLFKLFLQGLSILPFIRQIIDVQQIRIHDQLALNLVFLYFQDALDVELPTGQGSQGKR